MPTYSERLQHAMVYADMTQPALARAVGVSQQSIQYLTQKGKGSTRTTAIAKALNVNPDWLETGRGPMYFEPIDQEGESRSDREGTVPLIPLQQASEYFNASATGTPFTGDIVEWKVCPVSHSRRAFALRIENVSMTPDFVAGDIIFIDPQREARSGSFVVAQNHQDKKLVFRQLHIEGSDRYLQALNPHWPSPIIHMGEDWCLLATVLCKVVEY